MSVQYIVEESWLEHEGGTKFYHPLRILRMSSSGTKVVSAFHYGGFRGDRTPFRRPVSGGQVLIKAEDTYHSQIEAKYKKGYRANGTRSPVKHYDEGEFRQKLIGLFGRSDADQIFVGLGMRCGDAEEVSDLEEADLRPSAPSDHRSIEETIERPAAWGSW